MRRYHYDNEPCYVCVYFDYNLSSPQAPSATCLAHLHTNSPLAVKCSFFYKCTGPYRRERALYSLTRAGEAGKTLLKQLRWRVVATTGTGCAIWHSPTRQRQPLVDQM